MSPSRENTVNLVRELAPAGLRSSPRLKSRGRFATRREQAPSPQVIDSNVGQKRKVNPALIPLLLPRFDSTPL